MISKGRKGPVPFRRSASLLRSAAIIVSPPNCCLSASVSSVPICPDAPITSVLFMSVQCNGKFLGCRRKALLIITNHKFNRSGEVCFCFGFQFYQLYEIYFTIKIFYINAEHRFVFLNEAAVFFYSSFQSIQWIFCKTEFCRNGPAVRSKLRIGMPGT